MLRLYVEGVSLDWLVSLYNHVTWRPSIDLSTQFFISLITSQCHRGIQEHIYIDDSTNVLIKSSGPVSGAMFENTHYSEKRL